MPHAHPDSHQEKQSLFDLFDEVVDLPPADRAAALDAACRLPTGAPDPDLRRQVEAMLAADLEGGRLDMPAADGAPLIVSEASGYAQAEEASAQVGPWRLLRQIGQGGMGTVYLAERTEGGFEQQGALKRLLPAGPDRVRRFEQERQILAGLGHPGIARLLDGGLAGGDAVQPPSPYLVVEYVEGERITDYAVRAGLGAEDRVRLFLQVCDAVGHAHRHLIVHRDLKPSNVLVAPDVDTGRAQAKLLDFGIAKLMGEAGADLTLTGFPALTPEYAAPEQVTGGGVTAATDVYALGVLLYELLEGERPYTIERSTLSSVVESVCTSRPAPLSAEAAGGRGRQADLGAVVAKALEKEPERRYRSASELADDLRRHLDGLPVEARAPTATYRVGRFVRRHRAGVAVAALVALLLIGGGLLYTVRIAAERDRAQEAALLAEREASRSEQTALFLENVLTSSDPTIEDPGAATARELLDAASVRVRTDLAAEPLVLAQTLRLLGRVYRSLGLYDEAGAALEDAVAGFAGVGEDPIGHSDALMNLANVRYREGRYEEAGDVAREALRIDSLHVPEASSIRLSILNTLALVYSDTGQEERSVEALRDIIEMRRAGRGENPGTNLALNLNNLGLVLLQLGRMDEAEPVIDEAVALAREHRGPDHPYVAFALNARATLHEDRGDEGAALVDLQLAHDIGEAAMGSEHPFVEHVASRMEQLGATAQ